MEVARRASSWIRANCAQRRNAVGGQGQLRIRWPVGGGNVASRLRGEVGQQLALEVRPSLWFGMVLAPDGEVWACCIKAESMGNLRAVDHDFQKVWLSNKAQKIRLPIRGKRCFCPLANAGYTNMLLSYSTMALIVKNLATSRLRKFQSRSEA